MLRWLRTGAVMGALVLMGAATLAHAASTGTPAGGVERYRLDVGSSPDAPFHLYAEERGAGPPVVLLHGLGGSTYSWRAVAPVLARTHRVIALDLKGFGRSDKAFDTAYSGLDHARLVERFMLRRGLNRVTLIGHSFGAQVALLAALDAGRTHPDLIRQLVLIDAPVLPQPLSPLVAFMQQPVLPYALLTAIPADIITRVALTVPPDAVPLERPYTEADIEAYALPFHDAAARHAYVQTSRQIVPAGLPRILARYRDICQRTLLVWCAQDEVVPVATGERLVRMLPRARLTKLTGCNHAPNDEAPRALSRALLTFLNH